MGEDRFTDPIANAGEEHLLPAAAALFSGLATPMAFAPTAQVIYVTFKGTVGTIIGSYTDDGTTPTSSIGIPIYGGDQFMVTHKSIGVTKLIAVGTPIGFRSSQYKEENPYINRPA